MANFSDLAEVLAQEKFQKVEGGELGFMEIHNVQLYETLWGADDFTKTGYMRSGKQYTWGPFTTTTHKKVEMYVNCKLQMAILTFFGDDHIHLPYCLL